MKKMLSMLLIVPVLLLALCACSPSAEDPADPGSPSPSASPAPSEAPAGDVDLTQPLFGYASGLSLDTPAGTINGAPVSADLYFYQVDSACAQLAQYGMTDFSDEQMVDYVRTDAERALSYYIALEKLCGDHGIAITDAVRGELDEQLNADLLRQNMTREQLLQLTGLSQESFTIIYAASWMFDSLKEAAVALPSRAELEQFAEEKEVFSCKHILLKTTTEDKTGPDGAVAPAADYNAAQKALAEDLLSRIQAEGDSGEALLDQLAEQYSEDSRGSDGKLAAPEGYTFDESSSLVGGFREGTLALAIGETGITETDYGYHVIMRLAPDLDSYADQWRGDQLFDLVSAEMETADVQLTEAVLSVDLTDFYARCTAYREAVLATLEPAG